MAPVTQTTGSGSAIPGIRSGNSDKNPAPRLPALKRRLSNNRLGGSLGPTFMANALPQRLPQRLQMLRHRREWIRLRFILKRHPSLIVRLPQNGRDLLQIGGLGFAAGA